MIAEPLVMEQPPVAQSALTDPPLAPAAQDRAQAGALRVLLVAGDPLARAGLAALLAGAPNLRVVGQASDRDDAQLTLDAFRPSAVLLGLGWNSEQLDSLRAYADAGALVVVLLGSEADSAALSAIWASGARAVLGRSADAQQVAVALAAVAQGLALFDPAHALAPPQLANPGAPYAAAGASLEALTPRELEVLQGMADGLSNKLIARALGISEHTVKYHVNAILGKLQAQSRTEAVVRATRAGVLHL